MIRLAAFFALLLLPLAAQAGDITGTWQTQVSRYVVTIAKAKTGYDGQWYNLGEIDGSLNGNPLKVSRDGNTITFSPLRTAGTFTGTLSADGKTISGNWGSHDPTPLTFERTTAANAHPIDPSPHKVRFVTVAPGFVIDPSPHKTSFVTVDKGVKLEVLDWGGSGPPLVLLAGLGNTAHNFDKFALNFTASHHVYAITRRGFGASSMPAPTVANYDADRMGDDVIAAIGQLKLERPVLAGHSMAGEELSSIGSRHPEAVSGLIYLDAGYAYAYYVPGGGIPVGLTPYLDARELRQSLDQLTNVPAMRRGEVKPLIDTLLQKSLPEFQKDLTIAQMEMKAMPATPAGDDTLAVKVNDAILGGARKYTVIKSPVLAFYALPHAMPENAPPGAKAFLQAQDAMTAMHANAFEAGVAGSHVVRLANADHYVYRSNEADVTREMNAFMDQLAAK